MNKPTFEVYVDGTYHSPSGRGGWGLAVVDKHLQKVVYQNSGEVHDPEFLAMWNVAGELFGALMACAFASESNAKVIICHDYEGIAKWVTGEWKAKKPATQKYRNIVTPLYKAGVVDFRWVKGHSDNEFNDLVDTLARKAIGI